jgi:hypothetical protein
MANAVVVPRDDVVRKEPGNPAVTGPRMQAYEFGEVTSLPYVSISAEKCHISHPRYAHPSVQELQVLLVW